MRFFDKLFGSDDEPDFSQLGGLIESDRKLNIRLSDIDRVDLGIVEVRNGSVLKFRDPEKVIKKEAWDALTESARNELEIKGYYCEGDDNAENIVVIDP